MKKLFLIFICVLTSINLVKAQCDLSFDSENTGANMTVFFTPDAASSIYAELGFGTVGAFYTDNNGSYVCGGLNLQPFNGSPVQVAVMADDSLTPEKDGFIAGDIINWFYKTDDGGVYSLDMNPIDNFIINETSFIQSASITEIDCGGCDDSSSSDQCPPLDFDFVNTGSNMTLFIVPDGAAALSALVNGTIGVYYTDNDGQLLCGGATAFLGSQVQITAMADDSTTPEKDGFSSGEAIFWKFEDDCGNQYDLTPSPLDGFALNGISFISEISYDVISCVVDIEGCTEPAANNYNADATVDDGSCEFDVNCDAAVAEAFANGVASVTPDDGISQADVDAAYADGVASVTPDDGISQADVDAAVAASEAQADADFAALQALLDEALANSGGGSCEPIYIDLLEGWNIMGYTLPTPQDVVATLASIVSNVQIVKNNSAEVYWPEFGFNGIGDFIPGLGYQIRMYNGLDSFTFPDVGGQRIELSPSVPEWVYNLPVLNHPNDVRTLFRVVNMLGQQVDPNTQFAGEILLYLYNDGTTEKRIVN